MAATPQLADPRLTKRSLGGVPDDAKPFVAVNATAITSTTPVAIKAAVTGKRHWITGAFFSQPTAAEAGVLTLEDDSGTPIVIAKVGFSGALQGPTMFFEPPAEVAAGKAINGVGSAATGDAFITVMGFVEA